MKEDECLQLNAIRSDFHDLSDLRIAKELLMARFRIVQVRIYLNGYVEKTHRINT